jgi:hypothetical protein
MRLGGRSWHKAALEKGLAGVTGMTTCDAKQAKSCKIVSGRTRPKGAGQKILMFKHFCDHCLALPELDIGVRACFNYSKF